MPASDLDKEASIPANNPPVEEYSSWEVATEVSILFARKHETYGELATDIQRFPTSSPYPMEYPICDYVLNLEDALNNLGEEYVIVEPKQPRAVFRGEMALFENAQRLHMPPAILRWLQGVPDRSTECR